jgi:peptidoglycan hydrolase-like protein with peptidoglycan-binding domain
MALILEVQKILAGMGIYRGKLDGDYGPQTKQAVATFQGRWNTKAPTDKKLNVDGIPGPLTCQALQTT